jgi:hypothetical protein
MNGFVDLHGESITGVINTFDRVIFKGHLNGFFPDGAFGCSGAWRSTSTDFSLVR